MGPLKVLSVICIIALIAGIGFTAAGHLYPNVLDRRYADLVLSYRSVAYDHTMVKLTELYTTDEYLKASIPIIAYGDEDTYAWWESSAKALLLAEAMVSSLKYTVNRRRPTGPHERSNASFPSSHASASFAFAVTVARRYPEYGPRALEAAAYVSLSRIYLERHHPSDVIAGAAIGVAAGLISEVYLFWLHFGRETLLDLLLMREGMVLKPEDTFRYFEVNQ